jgi:hypothetical protein
VLQIDWEQWIGVRGAAVVGVVVLAPAGVYLFRYSIESGVWELTVDSGHPHFVRYARIEAREGGEVIVRTQSVFRLAGSGGAKTRLFLPDPGAKRFRVVLEGEEGFFLEPRFYFRSERHVGQRQPIVLALETIALQSDGGRAGGAR